MPSKAYKNYQKNLIDVERLINSHNLESGNNPGKKGLGHLTRSGVVMLCAAFEVYIEEVVFECIEIFIEKYPTLKCFPKPLRQRLAQQVKAHKNELEVLNLIGEGWKDVLQKIANQDLCALNTPKPDKVDILFKRYIGISDFFSSYCLERKALNDFVSTRGHIAHNGSQAQYIKIKYLKKSIKSISDLAKIMDAEICDHLTGILPENRQPWRKRYDCR
jgi:hypothetical protein